jgi:hypothetical protein
MAALSTWPSVRGFGARSSGRTDRVVGGRAVAIEAAQRVDGLSHSAYVDVGSDRGDDAGEFV